MKLALPDKLYYSIKEVSHAFGVNASLLRFWEKEFGILKPQKNSKGDRKYTKKDIEVIKKIYYYVKEKGFTIKGAKEQLKNKQNVNTNTSSIEKEVILESLIVVKKELQSILKLLSCTIQTIPKTV